MSQVYISNLERRSLKSSRRNSPRKSPNRRSSLAVALSAVFVSLSGLGLVAATFIIANFYPDSLPFHSDLQQFRETTSHFLNLSPDEKLKAPEDVSSAATSKVTEFLLDEPSEQVDEKLQLLVEEFVRVRSYEKSIQSKVSVLDNLIQNALELDHTLLSPKLKAQQETSASDVISLEEGVGGGDWRTKELEDHTVSQVSRSNVIEREDTVTTLQRSIEMLENIPIGAPLDGRYTSGFGRRKSPFSRRWHNHKGLDIAVARRSVVSSTANGTVTTAGYLRGYGKTIKIDHGNGIQTVFGHLQKIMVKKGQKICRGQQIGQVGSTGRSTGPHLHYEVRVNGKPKNPKRFVKLAELLRLAQI